MQKTLSDQIIKHLRKQMKTVNRFILAIVVTAGFLISSTVSSRAVVTYNDTVTAIFGSGNPNGGWVTSHEATPNLSLSLRAKDYNNGSTPNNGAGTYTFLAGTSVLPNLARWNYEFSINADPALGGSQKLNAYDFYLSALSPVPPVLGVFNPLTILNDNSYGNSSTLNGQGLVGTAATYAAISTIAQNSENIFFTGLNANATGDYVFALFATQVGAGINGARIAQADMTVHIVAVPEPTTAALGAIGGLALFLNFRRRSVR